jgi:endoglucanase
MRRFLYTLLTILSLQLGLAAIASASVHLDSTSLVAGENQGRLTVTVDRTGSLLGIEHVYYGTHKLDSTPGIDYLNVGGLLLFLPGQRTATFTIPIIPHDWTGPAAHVAVYLYSSWPESLGQNNATLAIVHNATPVARDALNPLELTPAPPAGNPLAGARFYADRVGSPAARAMHSTRNPSYQAALRFIANQPWADRFGGWNGPDPSQAVFTYLRTAQMADPGAVPLMATYRLVANQCREGGRADSPAQVAAYHRFVDGLARGVGNFRAVLFLEMDSLITSGCLHPYGLSVRLAELRYAVNRLATVPHLVVYIDAGAGDANSWSNTARMLNQAGVHQAQGFLLNATHYDWTTSEIAYGQRISRALGGVHFVVNTGDNGQGPLVPPDRVHQGNEVLCNPAGRGLGPLATTNTGFKWVDAFAWTTNPGESGGACVPGAPPTGRYWPAYAVMLYRHANFNVTGPAMARLARVSRARPHR